MKLGKIGLLIGVAGFALSQESSAFDVLGNIEAVVNQNFTFTETQALNFGSNVQGDVAKTVGVADAGRGVIQVTADPVRPYTITPPNTPSTLNGSTGGTLTVDQFVADPTGQVTGNQTINVGATLSAIASDQPAGTYTGTYVITLQYQ